jgi:hypothetical protein
MSKQKKQPKVKAQPAPQKQPKIAENPQDYYNRNPAWRISKMELASCYGWQNIDGEKLKEIQTKLSNYESMTWREILVDSKKQNHTVPINDLSKLARERLTEMNLEDLDELTSLRLSGTERIWGKVNQGVMELLWWDPKHEVYPTSKKNT